MIKKLLHSKIFRSKDGKFDDSTINFAIVGLILLVILLAIYAVLVPEAQTAGNALNVSNQCQAQSCSYNVSGNISSFKNANCWATEGDMGVVCAGGEDRTIPLSGLFSGTGVVFVLVMAALIILIVRAYIKRQ